MYRHHFRLSARPFAETVDPSAYVPVPGREAILHRLRYGLESGPGGVALIGLPGVGKSLLARRLAKELGDIVIHLAFPVMSATELLGSLADRLSAPRGSVLGVGESIERIRRALTLFSLRGVRPIVIVDEAHLIPDPQTFEALRLLLNFASRGVPDLGLVLVGDPSLADKLPPSLAERLAGRHTLPPLTASESAAYIHGRLAMAGASGPLFGPDSLKILHRESDGLPRRLNRLADLAMLIAYAQERTAPDAECSELAAREAGFERAA